MENVELNIPVDDIQLKGDLSIPDNPKGLIIFSHGSGSSRLSPRNRSVALALNEEGFATLLFDLLTTLEDLEYERRFDIPLLSQRLISVTEWIKAHDDYQKWDIGFFGASTGAASALEAAADLGPEIIKAVVSRGGRPDLAIKILPKVKSPTLLIVGSLDIPVIKLNKKAFAALKCEKEIKIVEGASHLFEEKGTLEQVMDHAIAWFTEQIYYDLEEIDEIKSKA